MPQANQLSAQVEQARHIRINQAFTELYLPRRAPVTFPILQKEKLYDLCAEALAGRLGTYLEFGVYRGWSMFRMVQRFTNPEARFYGFDSFQGLPEQWGDMGVGHFSTEKQFPDIKDARVQFIAGWFQNTVSRFLHEHAPLPTPVLVNFDADLYSSTLFLLTALWHFVPEYYFYFDEFMPDEAVAMFEFTSAYPVEFEFFAATETEQQWPQQVYGRLKNIALQV